MSNKIFSRKISFFVFIVFCFSTFFYPFSELKAGNIKTIVITFNSAPTYANVTKATLKYNKDFAWSYSFDDGLIAGFEPAFKYMNGGYSDYLGQYFGGLYFTDGAGNNVPFRGGYAFYTRNSSYSDIHINTPSYIKWTQLQEAVDNGWNVLNHGYTSATVPENDPDRIYYNGDPGGHATGPLDYSYELTQARSEVASHINLKNNVGAITVPLNMSHVILPNGDDNYIQPAFDIGAKGVYAQSGVFPFTDGSTTINAPDFTNVTNSIPTTGGRHVMPRWFDYEYRYLAGGPIPNGLFNHVDELATLSSGSTKYWSQSFTHQITTSTYAPDWSGGMTWTTWKSLMDHVENTYGRFGNDKVWVAGVEEVYNYMMVKQNSVLSKNLVGNQLTVTIDTTNVPTDLNNYSLSLLVDSDATISSINYGSDFSYHTDNKSTGLINLDWGDNSYSKNDISRVETLVSSAESAMSVASISLARTYVDMLDDSTQLTQKDSFNNRLDLIVVPLRTWYIKVRGDFTSSTNANNFSTTTSTYSPSPYNWNRFGVVKDSTITPTGNDLVNLKDADGLVSTISLSNTAPFKYGGLSGSTTGNNTGLYPDEVISGNAQIYSSTTTPAKIKIYGLNNSKNYNIKLFGNTSATGKTGDSATTQYTIGGIVKELYVRENILNNVSFTNITPVNGEIEITINPKVSAWGYGFLNAMEIIENLLPAPTNLSYTSPNTYTKNSPITSLTPTVTGLGITYSVSPSLPAGLSLNTSNGVISGTPTTASSLSTYTVTATNNGGSASFGVAIAVNNIAPTSLSYTSPNTYTKNTAITSLPPTVTGEEITYSVSPSLPAGLSLDQSTGVISGTPNTVSGLSTYTVTASNTGGSTTFDISITVNSTPVDTPVSSPVSGNFSEPQTVSLSSAGSNYIKYSTTAMPATCNDGTLYSSPLNISSSQTVYVRACNSDGFSSVDTFSYIITISDNTPPENITASPSPGSYNSSQSVSLGSTDGDYIKYSTTAMPVTCNDGTLYSSPLNISSSQTIYARVCDNAGNSSTANFIYVIPNQQNNNIPPTVRYSTISFPADCSSGSLYDEKVVFSSSQTIYLRTCDSFGNSILSEFEYVAPVKRSGSSGNSRLNFSSNNLINTNLNVLPKSPESINTNPNIEIIAPIKKISKDLKFGIKSPDVKTLQMFLISQNAGPQSKALSLNGATTYFGSLTKLALSEWQKANGVKPAVGYFGPVTRSKIGLLNL